LSINFYRWLIWVLIFKVCFWKCNYENALIYNTNLPFYHTVLTIYIPRPSPPPPFHLQRERPLSLSLSLSLEFRSFLCLFSSISFVRYGIFFSYGWLQLLLNANLCALQWFEYLLIWLDLNSLFNYCIFLNLIDWFYCFWLSCF